MTTKSRNLDNIILSLIFCCSFTKSCAALYDSMDCSTPGFLPFTVSQSLLIFMSIESVLPSNHLILCRPFSSCPQSFPESGSFPMSRLFASGGQGIGASASVLLMNIQGWMPLGLAGLISAFQGTLKNLLQHHSSKASLLQSSAFFMVHFSHLYMTTGKKEEHSFDNTDFCRQSNVSAF